MTAGVMVDRGAGVVAVAFGALLPHAVARRATRVSVMIPNLATAREPIATWCHLTGIRPRSWPQSHVAEPTVLQRVGEPSKAGRPTWGKTVQTAFSEPTVSPWLRRRLRQQLVFDSPLVNADAFWSASQSPYLLLGTALW
jgi:hypothetical protein